VLVFVAASVALVLIPGPNVLFVLARGLSGGRRAAVISMLGVETATACFVAAAAFGLTALLVSSELAFAVVRYAGALYLVYLAIRAFRSGVDVAPAPGGRTFRQGFLVGISNPKVAVFFLAFLPQFGSTPGRLLLLGAVFLAVASTLDLGWALLAGVLGRWLRRHPAVLRRQRFLTAPIYLALAGYAGTS
jgi:threonine/homoserine/homoserine lactone efflux protein